MYRVKLSQFEGPLAALLDLIEKRKLSINEISLAKVTDQYVEYLKSLEGFPMEEVAGFIAVASTLLLIKSSSLIPSLELSEEETGDIKDLERRLKLYKLMKGATFILGKNFGKNLMFGREAFLGCSFDFLEPKGATKEKLFSALSMIVKNLPQKEILPNALVKKTVSLEKKISEIISRIQKQIEISFSEAFSEKNGKIEVIVGFLAILELIKRGFVAVEQAATFDSIKIKKNIA
ncbi:MAG: Segregation and condensation protein A [Candidatus Nomurabacteria bacterium GW2011_GWA1_37_20]|uniref:Segregation and condensation protein A n=1 Tax=Candidatus Nomurabacteria bacterium GW2011_GWA1_37_20 TaxID=1618729 RepID=A0A0G0GVP5_9BACT|nr:MAG: Segregation and condensation protein A [Candidatus Nomurabacteria bacterium GW2011_GWA1_37_20]